jgi:hypothetical protein
MSGNLRRETINNAVKIAEDLFFAHTPREDLPSVLAERHPNLSEAEVKAVNDAFAIYAELSEKLLHKLQEEAPGEVVKMTWDAVREEAPHASPADKLRIVNDVLNNPKMRRR